MKVAKTILMKRVVANVFSSFQAKLLQHRLDRQKARKVSFMTNELKKWVRRLYGG